MVVLIGVSPVVVELLGLLVCDRQIAELDSYHLPVNLPPVSIVLTTTLKLDYIPFISGLKQCSFYHWFFYFSPFSIGS